MERGEGVELGRRVFLSAVSVRREGVGQQGTRLRHRVGEGERQSRECLMVLRVKK